MRALIRAISHFPFTTVGILSFGVFLAGAFSDSVPFADIARILVIPAWISRMGVVVLGVLLFPPSPPDWYWIVSAPLHLAPFVLLDVALSRAAR